MLKLQKLKGNPVYYQSDNGKVVVTYDMYSLGNKYKVYAFKDGLWWEYCDSFLTLSDAIKYSKKLFWARN